MKNSNNNEEEVIVMMVNQCNDISIVGIDISKLLTLIW